jgi:subtilisin-like proprotein convertase family protein
LPAPQAGNPETGQDSDDATAAVASFLRGSVVQQFYVTNWYHDRLYSLGFTPASRNFQQLNFGGGGVQGDRVLVDVQDGQSVDNANFATPSDGVSGRAQMFNFTGPVTTDRDGGLDTEILIHELTHGTSNRLVGNAAGLFWDIGGGMGEGWSDFYALSLLNNTNADNPDLGYASGGYATYKMISTLYVDNYTYGIRRFPYHTTNTTNPLTWADVDDVTNNLSGGMAPSSLQFNDGGGMEVHNAGEIWTLTLWEVRSRIIADPAGANGNVPTGNNTTLSIVTDAMRLFTPSNPSFVQGRDALIDADCAANAACPNEVSIWGGFADRGLGYGAVAPLGYGFGLVSTHMGVGESFASPNLDINTLTIDDTLTNNSGGIDPNETVRLVFNVRNPWRGAARNAAGVTATLTTSTPGATVVQGVTTYPAIAANGNANPTGPFLLLKAPTAAPCGSSIDVTLTLNSSLGSVARNYKIRLGIGSGTSTPVIYTRNPAPDVAIPDNAPRGISDPLAITDDFEIADLNFSVDSLTHTWIGDVTVMLRAPNGYGTDLISVIGCGVLAQCNSGDNLTNTLIDQTAVAPNDLFTSGAGAPFTGDWLPIFNSPGWIASGFPSIDPVGQLNRLNGMSTQGTWTVRVSDVVAGDVGSLNQWSLIVTPRAFTCTPFAPTAAPVSISGRVLDTNSSGVMKATVTVTDTDGETHRTLTNAWGYFRIENLEAGQTYLLEIGSKRFIYAPRSINAVDDVADLIFMPLE